jgi:hypothetical protein
MEKIKDNWLGGLKFVEHKSTVVGYGANKVVHYEKSYTKKIKYKQLERFMKKLEWDYKSPMYYKFDIINASLTIKKENGDNNIFNCGPNKIICIRYSKHYSTNSNLEAFIRE